MNKSRRKFIKDIAITSVAIGIAPSAIKASPSEEKEMFFKISLAQWSLHRKLWAGELDHLDFPAYTKNNFDIHALEYVSTFFKSTEMEYLKELKMRTDDLNLRNVLIMVDMQGSIGNLNEEARIRKNAKDALSFFGTRLIGYRYNQPASALSYANRRRLEIARAMATEAKLLLLDEPTAGMNPRETQQMTELIGRLRDEKGYTIIFIEHDMRVVGGVSDRVVVLDYGEKIAEGSYSEISKNKDVLSAYLGREGAATR